MPLRHGQWRDAIDWNAILNIQRSKAIFFLVLVTAIWGTSFPITKSLTKEIDQQFGQTATEASAAFRTSAAVCIIAMRFTLAFVLFLICYPSATRQVRKEHLLAGTWIGATFFVGLVLQVIGLATIPASRSGFLTSLTVVFIPMFTTVAGRRAPQPGILLAAALAMIGVSILTGLIDVDGASVSLAADGLEQWTSGDSLTILSALFFSGQILLIDSYGRKHDSMAFTPSMFLVTAIGAWIAFAASVMMHPADSRYRDFGEWASVATQPTFIALIISLALFSSLIAFSWMNKYQPSVTALQAGIIYTLEPVFVSLFATFLPGLLSVWIAVTYPNEIVTAPLIIGGVLVVGANLLALRPKQA